MPLHPHNADGNINPFGNDWVFLMPKKHAAKIKDLFAYAHDNRPSIVYMATNIANGKRYIGITRLGLLKRSRTHFNNAKADADRHRPSRFYHAIRKYGAQAFRFEELVSCDTYEEARRQERLKIASLRPEYNLTFGGEGVLGHRHSPGAKNRMSRAKKGRAPWAKGACPPEVREKLSRSAAARKGTFSEESRAKMRAHQNYKRANAKRERPVLCIDDGFAFRSLSAASIYYGLHRAAIEHCCAQRSKTCGGRVFRYVDKWFSDEVLP